MQFTAALALFLGAVAVSAAPSLNPNVAINATSVEALAPSANSWRMETWSGTSCTGEHFIWSAPDGHSCTNLAAVSSLKVTNLGGCRTIYFAGNNCQGSPVRVTSTNSCMGYSRGERVKSFQVDC